MSYWIACLALSVIWLAVRYLRAREAAYMLELERSCQRFHPRPYISVTPAQLGEQEYRDGTIVECTRIRTVRNPFSNN